MKVFSQEKITGLSAAQLPWQGIWEAAGRAARVFPGAQGGTGTWTEQSSGTGVTRAVPPITDPVTVTLPNTKLTFTSHIFCSLILSSGSFHPREISLQVPALNPLTTVTLSVFPELWKSQRSAAKPPACRWECQVSSGEKQKFCWRNPLHIHSGHGHVDRTNNQTQISCWNSDA